MHVVKRLWLFAWKVAIVLGFAGLGVLGLGLMVGAVYYPTGLFWGVIVFLMGVFGVLLVAGTALMVKNRPDTGSLPAKA